MSNKVYCGLDFHKNQSELCFMNSEGKVVDRVRIESQRVVQFLSNRSDLHIGIEASGGVFEVVTRLKSSGHEVTIINPSQFRAIGIGGKKTDRKDAEAIATALRLGFVPSVHHKSERSRQLNSLLASRDLAVRQRVALTNHIRGILREYGIAIPQGKADFFEKADQLLSELSIHAVGDMLLQFLNKAREYQSLEKEIEGRLAKVLENDERVARLQEVPGVGPLSAAAFVAAIDDPHRFDSGRRIGSYLGLVPRESSSGNRRRLGHITKCGPEMVRRYLIHGARNIVAKKASANQRNKQWAQKLESRAGTNKAVVALAHKNARICLALLRNNTRYGHKKIQAKVA